MQQLAQPTRPPRGPLAGRFAVTALRAAVARGPGASRATFGARFFASYRPVRCAAAVDDKASAAEQRYLEAVVDALRKRGGSCPADTVNVSSKAERSKGSAMVKLLRKFPHVVSVEGSTTAPVLRLVPASESSWLQDSVTPTGLRVEEKSTSLNAAERDFVAAAVAALRELGGSSTTSVLSNRLGNAGSSRPKGSKSVALHKLLKRFPDFVVCQGAAVNEWGVRLASQEPPKVEEAVESEFMRVLKLSLAVDDAAVSIPPTQQAAPRLTWTPSLQPVLPWTAARRAVPPARAGWSLSAGRSAAQRAYHAALFTGPAPYVVAVGPAGTGKTHIAVQNGAAALLAGTVQRLIITRPAVAVDEDLGFLPGGVDEKMQPYLVPILDLLADIWPAAQLAELQAERRLQVVPLGFMRGRTFNDAFIVADEMQNCSVAQMRTLLTRLGEGSRMVITGDLNQADADAHSNGLIYVVRKLRTAMRPPRDDAHAVDESAAGDDDDDTGSAEGGAAAAQLPLRDAVRRDFELVELDAGSVQRNAAVQTALRLLG